MKMTDMLFRGLLAGAGLCLAPAAALAWSDPATTLNFQQALASIGASQTTSYAFDAASTFCYSPMVVQIRDLTTLGTYFSPFGIAGNPGTLSVTTGGTTYYEYEKYLDFTHTGTFQFASTGLNIIGTIINAGTGIAQGNLGSGQIWTKSTYNPGSTGFNTYAFDVSEKVSGAVGSWPDVWTYAKNGDGSQTSAEIDNAELNVAQSTNQTATYGTPSTWTGNLHGGSSVVGSQIYAINSSLSSGGGGTYNPGFDLSAAFHHIQFIWTPDAVFQYLDGTLLRAQHYTYTPRGTTNPAQLGINMAIGTQNPGQPGLVPNSTTEFQADSNGNIPLTLSIQNIMIYGAN